MNADQSVDLQIQRFQGASNFPFLALGEGNRQPVVCAGFAVQYGLDRLVVHAVDRDAFSEFVDLLLCHRAVGAHAIGTLQLVLGQFQCPGQRPIIGQQQQALGRQVEAANGDNARQGFRQFVKDGTATFRILRRRDEAGWLMIAPETGCVGCVNCFAANPDQLATGHLESRGCQLDAIDGHLALFNHALDFTARSNTCAGKVFGDPFAFAPVLFEVWLAGFGG